MTRNELLKEMDGMEIRLHNALGRYETDLGVVAVKDGKVIADGHVIDSNPSKEALSELWDDVFYGEFGTNNVNDLI